MEGRTRFFGTWVFVLFIELKELREKEKIDMKKKREKQKTKRKIRIKEKETNNK